MGAQMEREVISKVLFETLCMFFPFASLDAQPNDRLVDLGISSIDRAVVSGLFFEKFNLFPKVEEYSRLLSVATIGEFSEMCVNMIQHAGGFPERNRKKSEQDDRRCSNVRSVHR
jgi:hypothetical protein